MPIFVSLSFFSSLLNILDSSSSRVLTLAYLPLVLTLWSPGLIPVVLTTLDCWAGAEKVRDLEAELLSGHFPNSDYE